MMGNKAKICFVIKSMIQKQKPLTTTTVTQSTTNNTENKTLFILQILPNS